MEEHYIERLWTKVDRTDEHGCWPFIGSTDGRGRPVYGVKVDGKFRMVKAYRVAFFAHHGRWPAEGLYVLHSCDNPLCCNPAHLREGTQADNMADAAERQRMPKGAEHWLAKLDETKVREIRKLGAEGCSRTDIAARFGVSDGPVKAILEGKTWKHVLNEDGSVAGRIAGVANKGRRVKSSRLDEEKVRLIRKLASERVILRTIANQLDVGLETVRQVVVGASWKHVV